MSRRTPCTARTAQTGRPCRAHGCWQIPGGTDLYCKRHAQEAAAFTDDPRIINAAGGRIEFVDARTMRCRGRVGPLPQGADQIASELRTVRCRKDWSRCFRAIAGDIPAVLDMRTDSHGLVYAHAVNRDVAEALYIARQRLEQIGATP